MTTFTNIQQPTCAVSRAIKCKVAFEAHEVRAGSEKADVVQAAIAKHEGRFRAFGRKVATLVRSMQVASPSQAVIESVTKDGIRPPSP